jgi:hypothetical protein
MKLSGKGIFVFSDPAGAKAVLALAKENLNRISQYLIISDRQYPFFADFGLQVSSPRGSAEETLRNFSPDFIFTGTSYTSKIELQYIEAARRLGISSGTFIDHWTNMGARFTSDKVRIYPDNIYVIDKRAKDHAMADGIPAEILHIAENPYYSYLKTWKPRISREECFSAYAKTEIEKKKILAFLPEPLSNVGGTEKYGFDEITVFSLLCDALNNLDKEMKSELALVVKPHPNQKPDTLDAVVKTLKKNSSIEIIYVENMDVNSLMYYSILVIGMFSNSLIEAQCLHKPVLRILPELKGEDTLEGVVKGPICSSETDIRNELPKFLGEARHK